MPIITKGSRYNAGKKKWSLVDFDALEPMIDVLEFGSKKYGPNNWKKGLKVTETIDSLIRHLIDYLNGEDSDKESGLPLTGHILCNAMFLAYTERFNKGFDDRFKDVNKSKCCGDWDENGICKCKLKLNP